MANSGLDLEVSYGLSTEIDARHGEFFSRASNSVRVRSFCLYFSPSVKRVL